MPQRTVLFHTQLFKAALPPPGTQLSEPAFVLECVAHTGWLAAQVSHGMFAKTTGKIEDRWQAFMTYQIHRAR